MKICLPGMIENAASYIDECVAKDEDFAGLKPSYGIRELAKNLHWLREQHAAGNGDKALGLFFAAYVE